MADSTLEHAFFYNSEDGDRVYDASSFEYWLKRFFTTGVFSGDCAVTAGGDMTITVAEGYANVDGKVKFFEEATDLELETANTSYDRIDAIVIERNDSDRDVTLKVVTGSAAASPKAAEPERESGVYQLVLAQIYVAAGATAIRQANVTDTRSDSDLCGIVSGTVDEIDFSQITAQFEDFFSEYEESISERYTEYEESLNTALSDYETSFEEWFTEIQDQLTEDAAGNLQTQITALQTQADTIQEYVDSNSGTVGSGTIPTYLNEGVVTASGETVGDSTMPIYLNEGELTASTSTVGSATKPVYLNAGTLTASTSTVGSATKPIYLNTGTLTASSSTVGGTSQAVYLKSGTITAGLKVQKGSVSITPKANTPTSKTVTFSSAFSASPQVVATPITEVPGTTVLGVGVTDVSKTGFTLYLTRTNNTSTSVRWIAIGY